MYAQRKQEHLDQFRLFMFNQLDSRLGHLLPAIGLGGSRDLLAPVPADQRRKSWSQKVFDVREMAARLVPEVRAIWSEHWGRTEKGPIDAAELVAEYLSIWLGGCCLTGRQISTRANQRRSRRHSLTPAR
jgi:hypothetical protein